ncbi:alcohol dehydrogenase catalytic domain-containing protein [Agrobacterium sp. P15N1-A]|uniref:alcohol dehydrogenase catalytic domain-containing protein n=1 Tax=Agrobacterium sp. P15N1-A TaxID=3342820 RepID=UPI0037D87657
MRAWQFTGAGEPLQLIERDMPHPGPGEVVVKVSAAGLCASDVHLMSGKHAELLGKIPLILGHETAGVIDGVGEGVTGFRVGDRVVVSGNKDYVPGFSVDGGYATHVLVRSTSLRSLPDGVSFEQGAVATDAGQTAYGAVMHSGGLQKGQRVGIIGLGGLGMTAVQLALANGAAEVYGAEPRREVWDAAIKRGAKEVVEDAKQFGQFDLDLIIDFAGYGVTTAAAIAAVRYGGTVVLVAAPVTEATIPTPDLIRKEVTLRGSQGGHPGATEAVLAHMQRGELEIPAEPIRFNEIPEGLKRLEQGGVNGRLVAVINTDAQK